MDHQRSALGTGRLDLEDDQLRVKSPRPALLTLTIVTADDRRLADGLRCHRSTRYSPVLQFCMRCELVERDPIGHDLVHDVIDDLHAIILPSGEFLVELTESL